MPPGQDPHAQPRTQLPISRRMLLTGAAAVATGAAVAGWPADDACAAVRSASPLARASSNGKPRLIPSGPQAVTFDQYSLMVSGERLFVFAGEFHPFRLPSPSLWRDILQKMKANGYNAVCSYFNWSYHSPAPGVYDFTGVRDMDLYLDLAAETGLYVLARPGPYINGELNGGGFPGWLTSRPGAARSDDSNYLGYASEWLNAINAVLARHQLTDGNGTVLLYQIENEYASRVGTANGIDYMAYLYATARDDGITVPIYHNDKSRNGDWVPGSFPGSDSNYLYAFDGYPSASSTPPDWGYFGTGGATGGSTASPSTPGFMAEFGGGWFDPWGGAPWDGEGYAYEQALPISTPAGSYTVPQNGTLELDDKDLKVVVANYRLDSQLLVYTTSHLMTHAPLVSQGGAVPRGAALDVALLVSRPDETGETLLRYPAGAQAPAVRALSGAAPTSSWDAATGDLLLDYTHDGVAEVLVTPPGTGTPVLLIIADDNSAASFWRLDTPVGAVVVYGPELLRTAAVRGAGLELTGDTTAAVPLRAWAPLRISELTWNGAPKRGSAAADGSYTAAGSLAAPPTVSLPDLTHWRYSRENPESQPGFDDSAWIVADHTTSYSATPVPAGQPVLFVDDYGFHYGDVWYRGSWSDAAGATAVNITYQSGQVGMLLAWLDGQYLGSNQMPTPTSAQSTTQGWSATVTLPLPATDDGTHVLAVLARSMSHQEDGGANNAFKTALGLTEVTFTGATPAVTWKIQGDLGGTSTAGQIEGGLGAVSLTVLGTALGGVPVNLVRSPGYVATALARQRARKIDPMYRDANGRPGP